MEDLRPAMYRLLHGGTDASPSIDDYVITSNTQTGGNPRAVLISKIFDLFKGAAQTFLVSPLQVTVDAAAHVGAIIQAAASQTADLLQLKTSAGTVVHRYNKAGYWVTALHSAPADADLSAGDAALWFDQTNGAGKLMVKAKTANGTVVTGSITLT